MTDPAISAVGLTKRYGDVMALDGVDLRVERGEIYGFLGLNGAGKSTTIRLLLDMVHPSSGFAEIFGVRVGTQEGSLWRRVGSLVEAATAYPELTVRENLEIARYLLGLSDSRPVGRIIERLGLGEYADRRAGALSMGNLQRLGLARALLHEPDLLVLDEPANGLDPAGVVEVRELLRNLSRERGVTVFMSSHILTEVDRLATRIGIVHQGRIIEQVSSSELERRRLRRLEIVVRDPERATSVLRGAGFEPARIGEGLPARLEVREASAIDLPDEIAKLLVQQGVAPLRLAVEQEEMEDYFLRLTAGSTAARR